MSLYKVKISIRENDIRWMLYENDIQWLLHHTKGGKGISKCGKYQFFLNKEIENPDFWAVLGKGISCKETCNVAPENTILMLCEPKTVINYPKSYREQFGMLCSCQKDLKHKNIRYNQAILYWFVGISKNKTKSYDDLIMMNTPPKNKLISVVTSNKAFTKGHHDRIKFVEQLKQHYGDSLDVFGRGFRPFDDKWDVLAHYKYHIAIENSSNDYYWTEKLSDCFITETYPIYYGCPNIGDYFPKDSYTAIDIHNLDEAIATIDRVIGENEYEKSRSTLKHCKELVLDKYNIFDMLASFCDQLDPQAPKRPVTLKPAISALDWHNAFLYIFSRNFYTLKMKFKNWLVPSSILIQ